MKFPAELRAAILLAGKMAGKGPTAAEEAS
jgi:hypothetical protein